MERVLLQYNRYVITPCKKDTDLSSIKSGNAVRSREIVSRTYKKVNSGGGDVYKEYNSQTRQGNMVGESTNKKTFDKLTKLDFISRINLIRHAVRQFF